jgi:hypothetical protein
MSHHESDLTSAYRAQVLHTGQQNLAVENQVEEKESVARRGRARARGGAPIAYQPGERYPMRAITRSRVRVFLTILGVVALADMLAGGLGSVWRGYVTLGNAIAGGVGWHHTFLFGGVLSHVKTWGGIFLEYGGTGRYNVKHPAFAAVVDGVTDDTAAFNTALAYAADTSRRGRVTWTGTALCATSLFCYGYASLEGNQNQASIILVDGFYDEGGTRTSKYFLACGVKSDETLSRWKGSVRHCRFEPGGNIGTSPSRIINPFDAEDYAIEYCQFIGFGDDVTAMKGQTDSQWGPAAGAVRKRGKYRFNCIDMSQTVTGAEQISVSAVQTTNYAEDIEVVFNWIEGGGDDAVAFHGVTRGIIGWNTCNCLDGRIIVGNSVDIRVYGNTVTHSLAAGGSSFILVKAADDGGDTRLCRNIKVRDNLMRMSPDQTISFAIRFQGVIDSEICGNTVDNESHTAASIIIGEITVAAVDYLSARINIRGNDLRGCRITISNSQRTGWVKILGNTIDLRGLFDRGIVKLDHFDGDEVQAGGITGVRWISTTQGFIDVEQDIVDAQCIGIWERVNMVTPTNVNLTHIGLNAFTGKELTEDLAFVPTHMVVTLDSAAVGGDDALIQLRDDGTVVASVAIRVADGDQFTRWNNDDVAADEPLGNSCIIRGGSLLQMRVNDPNGRVNGRDIQVEMWGVRVPQPDPDRGDASVTVQADTDPYVVRYNTTLTANRTVTLSTTMATKGARFRIVRDAATPGAFTLNVGGLQTIPSATAGVVDVEYNGSAWTLIKYSTL